MAKGFKLIAASLFSGDFATRHMAALSCFNANLISVYCLQVIVTVYKSLIGQKHMVFKD